MILASIYSLLRLLIGIALLRTQSAPRRDLELLTLRHQVAVLRRQVKRPELLPTDRLILAALGRTLPAATLLFSPSTLMRWHRELVRRKWDAFRTRPHRGRPLISAELQELVLRLVRENPRWGDRRVQGELLKLGYRVSATTIRMIRRRHRVPPSPRRYGLTWSQFLRAHTKGLLACDFLVVNTVLLGTLYVLVFLELNSRRVVFSSCTDHPDAEWVVQQARNVAMEMQDLEIPIQLLIHDRDSKFTQDFDAAFNAEGAKVALTPYRCPRANSHCERLLGTLRRESLDWLLIFDERHLWRVLTEFFDHYNRCRPHRALALQPPHPQPISITGHIIRRQRLHGLINEYTRAA